MHSPRLFIRIEYEIHLVNSVIIDVLFAKRDDSYFPQRG